ncbi:MAG: heavy-metal-associated domain-containing protein [Chitinophagaceae bacterium]
MKIINSLMIVVFAMLINYSSNAQASDKTKRTIGLKTQTFAVHGECELCKKRIEKAAYSVDGVKSAQWNADSKELKVTYSVFKKDAPQLVQQKIAAAGHDAGDYKATALAYQQLSCCCMYKKSSSVDN